jgi:nucleoside-diphosphate-sugar epimerase
MLREQDVVQVRGSLNRFRDLVYIDDVLQAWERCLHSTTAYNQIFNVGTGTRTTFGELIRALATVMGKRERLRIEELAGTPGDIEGCVADLTRIRERLGYAPRYDLATGLAQMWRWVDRGAS